jgi:uncharacterized protein YndB with AHSA1/START domain
LAARTPELDLTVVINAPLHRVLRAFFDGEALHAWWQVVRSVTTARTLGPYAVEWASTDFTDEVLGRLGGVFRGTVVQFDRESGFFVADAYWLPPDGEPIGPMAFEVALAKVPPPSGAGEPATEVRVRQTGFEESARWRRYYEVIAAGWDRALHSMRMLLEK